MTLVPWHDLSYITTHCYKKTEKCFLFYSRKNYAPLKVSEFVSKKEEKDGCWRKQLTVSATLVRMIVPWSEHVRADGILAIPEFHRFILEISKLSSREIMGCLGDCVVNQWQCPNRTQISDFQEVPWTFCQIHCHCNKWLCFFKNPLLERYYLSLYVKGSGTCFVLHVGWWLVMSQRGT